MGYLIILITFLYCIYINKNLNMSSKIIWFIGINIFFNDVIYFFSRKYILGTYEQLLILTIIFFLFLSYKGKKEKNNNIKYIVYISIILILIFLSDVISGIYSPQRGFYLHSSYLSITFILLVSRFKTSYDEVINVFINILILYVYSSILAVVIDVNKAIQFNYGETIIGVPIRYNGIITHANGFSIILAVSIIILIYNKQIKNRKIKITITTISLIFTQSKTSIIAIIVVIILNFIINFFERVKSKKKRVILKILLSLIFISIIIFIVPKISFDEITFTGRVRLWKDSLEVWKNHKILGYGPNFLNEEYRTAVYGINSPFGQAHNQFIQALAQNGIIGAILLITLLLLVNKICVYLLNKEDNYTIVGIFLLILIRMMTETPMKTTGMDFNWYILLISLLLLIYKMNEICREAFEGEFNGKNSSNNYMP